MTVCTRRRSGTTSGPSDGCSEMSSCRWLIKLLKMMWKRSATPRESFNDLPYAIDARRLYQTRPWVVYFSILSRFGPRRCRRGASERARSRRWREVARTDAVAATASRRCRMTANGARERPPVDASTPRDRASRFPHTGRRREEGQGRQGPARAGREAPEGGGSLA